MHILTQGPHSPQLPSRRPLRSHSPLETKLSIPTPHSNPPPLGGGGSAAAPTVKSVSPSSSPRGHRRVGSFNIMVFLGTYYTLVTEVPKIYLIIGLFIENVHVLC